MALQVDAAVSDPAYGTWIAGGREHGHARRKVLHRDLPVRRGDAGAGAEAGDVGGRGSSNGRQSGSVTE